MTYRGSDLRTQSTYPDRPVSVEFTLDDVAVTLASGEVLCHPLRWHPWLQNATPEQRANSDLRIFSVNFPDLDDGLDIEGMKRGIPSDSVLKAAYYQGDLKPASPELSLTEMERRLIAYIRQLPERERDLIDALLQSLVRVATPGEKP